VNGRAGRLVAAGGAAWLAMVACGTSPGEEPVVIRQAGLLTVELARPHTPRDAPPILLAAGDIASCQSDGDEATARLLGYLPGTVLTLGDNVYRHGTRATFAACYDSSWGRHRARTRPAPGNHEYHVQDAAGYFAYFGAAAGPPGRGYYSFDVGGWHVISLNSNVGLRPHSPQMQWLRADLAAHPSRCTLAYWHHPRFSSGKHGSSRRLASLWRTLYNAGVDVVLQGHDHSYERFAPLDADGQPDENRGIRSFVVGTGGARLRAFSAVVPGSEVRYNGGHGVLKLSLRPDSYEWEFLAADGMDSVDRGEGRCHGPRAP
jgi:acid phosphatase type 7